MHERVNVREYCKALVQLLLGASLRKSTKCVGAEQTSRGLLLQVQDGFENIVTPPPPPPHIYLPREDALSSPEVMVF